MSLQNTETAKWVSLHLAQLFADSRTRVSKVLQGLRDKSPQWGILQSCRVEQNWNVKITKCPWSCTESRIRWKQPRGWLTSSKLSSPVIVIVIVMVMVILILTAISTVLLGRSEVAWGVDDKGECSSWFFCSKSLLPSYSIGFSCDGTKSYGQMQMQIVDFQHQKAIGQLLSTPGCPTLFLVKNGKPNHVLASSTGC